MGRDGSGSVSVLRSIDTLFQVGAVGRMSDAELLGLYLDRRDAAEAAFETLVRRHGPMVFSVCRGMLADPNDAEDAFQATFFVLAKRASSIRKRGSIGSWLHGVARRVAQRAKSDANLRRIRETLAAGQRSDRETTDAIDSDLARIVHEELGRLPEKYRMPVLLCDAEGLTHESAAIRLGWPVGTVSGRLSRAHGILRDRLRRRGVGPVSIAVGAVAVPSSLMGTTARAAVQFASRGGIYGAAGAVSAATVALAEGVLKAMTMTKLIATATVLAGVGLATTGMGVLAVRGQGGAEEVNVQQGPEQIKEVKADPAQPRTAPPPKRADEIPKVDMGGGGGVAEPMPKPDVLNAIREAAKAAETIPLPGKKTATFIAVAEAYAKAGDRNSAKATYRTALGILEEGMQRKEQTMIIGGTTVFRDQPNLTRFMLLSRIADSQARNNLIEDAAETIKTVGDNLVYVDEENHTISRNQYLTEFVKAMAQDGKIEAALRLAEKIKQDEFMGTKTAILIEIAHIQSKDFPMTDRAWIEKLSDPAVKSRVLLGVVAGLSGQPYTPSKYRQPKPQ